MDPEIELQKQYPTRDFSCVFRFLASCPALIKGTLGTQEHHICPKKQYPQFRNLKLFPENGVVLSVADHAYVHLLTELCEPEIKAPATIYFEAQHRAACKSGSSHSREHFVKMGLKGGRVTAMRRAGICGLSKEQRIIAGRKGALAQTKETKAAGGRKGQITLKKNNSGFYSARIQSLGRKAGSSLGGYASQAVLKKKGTGVYSKKVQALGGLTAFHIRWHVKRCIVNPKCSLCQ